MYYFLYAVLCAVTGVAYIKFASTEGTVITTREFKKFQASFLAGYSLIILCELVASASFFHTFLSLKLDVQQITKLYLATILATTVTGVITEVIDIGTRKYKCTLSAVLYGISMFSILFGGHYERLLIGRIVYGVASSLHHSSFDAYAIHEHASHGFPDDWLNQTFGYLTHMMALMAALSGVVGQSAHYMGPLGCVGLCLAFFGVVAVYITVAWENDINTTKFNYGFISSLNQTLIALKANRHFSLLILISSLCETSISVFTYYWAPWMTSLYADEKVNLPFEIIFSSFIVASMLGNYTFQMGNQQFGSIESALQALLASSSASFFLGAAFQTPLLAFLASVVVQFCMGGYWPSIGYLRGKIIMSEFRATALVIPRY